MNKEGGRIWWILLAAVGYVAAALGLSANLGVGDIGFFNEFPHQKESEASLGIFSHT